MLPFLLVTTLLPFPALAADGTVDIGAIAGSYRRAVPNGDISGKKFTSTDRLDIIPLEPGRAFFSTELNFFNGHLCSLSGIAESERGALVYREEDSSPDDACELRLVPRRGRIVFEDPRGRCRAWTCGARGSYDDTGFSLALRRKITNLARRRAAEDYKEAVEAYRSRPPGETKPQP